MMSFKSGKEVGVKMWGRLSGEMDMSPPISQISNLACVICHPQKHGSLELVRQTLSLIHCTREKCDKFAYLISATLGVVVMLPFKIVYYFFIFSLGPEIRGCCGLT